MFIVFLRESVQNDDTLKKLKKGIKVFKKIHGGSDTFR